MADVPRPIRLVYHDEEGMFHMESEAVSILQRVKGPIGVVSVCGPVQEGKSYMSNQLLGRTGGFEMASEAVGQCTNGLWLWSSPLKKIAADGTEYSVLVMDSEGIDGGAQAEKYFYLAVVLSSMLIYNQMWLIKPAWFTRHLSLLNEMADEPAAGHLSPTFVWVLRDFLVHLGGMTPSEYMESTLEPLSPPLSKKDIAINKVLKSFQAVFPDRHCFTLVPPMLGEKGLGVLDQVPMDRLLPEFRKEMDELRGFVFEKTGPKKIGAAATVMTGPILVQIACYIVDAFNINGTWPMLPCILENVGKTERRPKPLHKRSQSPGCKYKEKEKEKVSEQITSPFIPI